MTTPADEIPEPKYPTVHNGGSSSSDEATVYDNDHSIPNNQQSEAGIPQRKHSLAVQTDATIPDGSLRSRASPSRSRDQATRLEDDLKLLQIERQISRVDAEKQDNASLKSNGIERSRSRREEVIDEFDVATNPLHETAKAYAPPAHPSNRFAQFAKSVHDSFWIIRYITYIAPLTLILLIPILIGFLVKGGRNYSVGGVQLPWFFIWLEIVWLTLWAGRLLAKCLPWPMGLIASLFTNNAKKWRDMGKQLEVPATLFFWWLGVEISFLPLMRNRLVPGATPDDTKWQKTVNKIWVSILVLVILNFIEKIIIQLIAISFHLRTYADRIELNKFQIASLTKLYQFSKIKIAMEDSDFEAPSAHPGSGSMTPGAVFKSAQKGAKEALNKFGDVAGKVAGDFTGKTVVKSDHPAQVTLTLLSSTGGSQVLARRLYRTFAREDTETVNQEDLNAAFESQEEADAAFSMFDKDMNGDISMEELEAVCVEIGRERKSITASLKDLDSVVGKLDDCLFFVVCVVSILVFISLISTSASGVLTSAGSAVLALSWLFSATAQEFLQSVIFVFVKHPFDVGDRVTIYGNTGSKMQGDDYFVKEISLLYTEFKKMEGHVVQAPNSYLNTLFILNMRRSGGLAEAIPMVFKFGTTLEQIEGLRNRLLQFVKDEKREYQGNILTELRDITEAHSISLNIVFFYKSNWQNELLRLQRRNKFFCALMIAVQELGIEGPRMRFPGQKEGFPLYMQNLPWSADRSGKGGTPDNPEGLVGGDSFVPNEESSAAANDRLMAGGIAGRSGSISGRRRGESLSRLGKRFDFSLGMSTVSEDPTADVFEERERPKIPISITSPSVSRTRGSTDSAGGPKRVDSMGLGHSSSRAGKSSTETHRNRFFGRRSTDVENRDIEFSAAAPSGTSGIPMRDMPMDPRTNTVGAQAVRFSTDDSTTFPTLDPHASR